MQEALRVVTGFELSHKDFSIINLLALPRAPRRSRPVSLRLGHAAALDATGIHSLPRRRFATPTPPATPLGSGGFAPTTPTKEETQLIDK